MRERLRGEIRPGERARVAAERPGDRWQVARRGRDAAGTGPRLETVPQEKVGECENPVGRGCLPRPQGSREASEAGSEGARAGDEMRGARGGSRLRRVSESDCGCPFSKWDATRGF